MAQAKEEKEIMAKFKRAKEARQEKDYKWSELVMFDRGEQWERAGTIPEWIPKPVTNWIHTVKTIKRAAFAIENPIGLLRPLSVEDEERITQLQKIYEFEWKRVKARKYVREAIESGKLLGTGITQIYYDEDVIGGGTDTLYEGEVRMKNVDVSTFFPDPDARTIEDCRFLHIVEPRSIEWLKNHPIFGKKMGEVEENNKTGADRGEIYKHSSTNKTKGMIDFHTHYEKKPNEDKDVGGFIHSVTYMAGDKIVHKQKTIKPNRYPFAIYYDYPQRQDFWGKSTCELIIDNQKVINKVESIIALIGTQLQNPQRIVSKQSGIDPKWVARYGSAPGHVFVSNIDPSRSMMWATPPQIPPALFNLAEQAKENIREVTGITQSYMGESVGSLQTSSGVSQLIDRATMRDRDQMFDVELYIEDLTRLFIAFITEYYDDERYIRVTEDFEDQYTFASYRGNAYTDLEYDFEIDVSAQAPVTRQRMQEEAENLLRIDGQYGQRWGVNLIDPEELIKLSDFTDKYKMIKRIKAERIRNRTDMAFEVAQMMMEAMQGGVPPEEVQMMGEQMIQQKEEELRMGIGSASETSGNIQPQGGIQ